eukprot:CAMPEP_0115018582 /NCGR_PEP_ID=MMETSP0216-20121206/28910_1 /TAXON_ID=223996 /ORGANISM="Protocruzia adherens, Strain Boccale" /LENGTH=315 /DNA_ID=CAMNT_0002389841 /DNA_START=934 /DNA_END=1881 /DNA_ORIENTATION=+
MAEPKRTFSDEEIVDYKKTLKDSDSSDKTKMQILSLFAESRVSRDQLKATKIGNALSNMKSKSTTSKPMSDLIDTIILKWKGQFSDKSKPSTSKDNKSTTDKAKDEDEESKQQSKTDVDTKKEDESQPQAPSLERGQSAALPDDYEMDSSGDRKRDNIRKLLAKGLLTGMAEIPENLGTVAAEIESACYGNFGGVNTKYSDQVRCIISNLKDRRNPELNSSLLFGVLPANELAKMKASDMASAEKKKQLEKKLKAEADAARSDWNAKFNTSTTNQFQCGKCKKNKTSYYQMQTRSADEPMTTFVTCLECGNSWKF